MTKILYNRAAKTFIDAIGAGFDEDGAYEKVKKKHGKVLADALWTEAQTEMKAIKENPRVPKWSLYGYHRLVGRHVNHWKKGRGKIIDERVDYVVVKFEDGSQDRFEKSRLKGN